LIPKITIAASFMIVVALAAASITGCSHRQLTVADKQQQAFNTLRETTLKTVTDPKRAERAAELNEKLLQNLIQLDQDTKDYLEKFKVLNADYDTTDRAFQEFFARQDARISAAQNDALDIHQQMMQLFTPEEWKKLSKVRDKSVEDYLKTIQ